MKPLNDALFAALRRMEQRNRRLSLVGDRAFFDLEQFSWIAEVEAKTTAIQAELQAVLLRLDQLPSIQDIAPEQVELTNDAGWKTFFFYMAGIRMAKNCRQCPATEQALLKIPGMVAAFYSILAPGKRLSAHRGPYNGVLRYHLGLEIPASDSTCAIRVGTETRSWAEGRSLVFDDTYEHEAWNLTRKVRAVLFVDFKRPLPASQAFLNASMIWLATRTPMVSLAIKNQSNWEQAFYK